MLSVTHRQQGVTLVELVIGMLIVILLFSMGVPSFMNWIQSAQIRTAADAVQNGLQLSRAAAVQRNANISFQLMTSIDSSCALSTAGPNWVISQPVSLPDATGNCDKPALDPPAPPVALDPTDPYIIQKRPAAEGSVNAVLAATQTTIVFNGLGRITPVPAGNIDIDISNPAGGTCTAVGGTIRCLRVTVSPNGQIRMCDPAVTFGTTTPQGC